MKRNNIALLCFAPILLIALSCKKDSATPIKENIETISFKAASADTTIKIKTGTGNWKITSDQTWCTVSPETIKDTATKVTIKVSENASFDTERVATLIVSKESNQTNTIKVIQRSKESYPSYVNFIASDATGMSSTAQQLASKIKLGWNIGNTLEAIGGETAWGNPLVTKDLINMVKKNGFNAIRIPCSWNQNMENSSTAQLKQAWLDRVKAVVQMCIDDNMYVLLNIHWDSGWLENNCTIAKQKENNAKQKAFWEQIATQMRGFDEHLLFASANEPNVDDATQMSVLNSYHQTFINAVRSTGGKNSYRVLVVQGPSTDIEKTNKLMTTLPNDAVPNRMMVEIHYYTPYNFCGLTEDADWGKMFNYWGSNFHSATDPTRNATWGEEGIVDTNLNMMKTQFVDKGIPVIMGEYGAIRRTSLTGDALTLHLASRAYYLKYVTKKAIANGILPFYWDEGSIGNNGFGLFNRKTNTVFDQQALDAIVQGATGK